MMCIKLKATITLLLHRPYSLSTCTGKKNVPSILSHMLTVLGMVRFCKEAAEQGVYHSPWGWMFSAPARGAVARNTSRIARTKNPV